MTRNLHFYCITAYYGTLHYGMQVHEKSILLALLPVTLLALEEPVVAAWLPVWATISMYPLLKKDGLSMAYVACLILWFAVAPGFASKSSSTRAAGGNSQHSFTGDVGNAEGRNQSATEGKVAGQQCLHYLALLSIVPAICIHAAQIAVSPPVRLLHLYDAAFVTLAFVHIAATFIYLNIRQHVTARTDLDSMGHNL